MDAKGLSKEFADSVLPVTIFFGILAVFGVLGNIFVLYVYKYKYPLCNFRIFVSCLATADFVSCLFVFPCEIVGHRIWFSYPKSAVWFCKLKTFIFGIAVMTSSLILLLIATDRYRKVCRPLGPQISHQNAFRLCVVSLAIAVIMTIPIPILFGIQHENITYGGESIQITSCEKDDDYKDTIWMTVYLILIYYIPIISFMATTTVLYSIVVRKMFSRNFLKNPYTTLSKQSIICKAEAICSEGRPAANSVLYVVPRSSDLKHCDEDKIKIDDTSRNSNNDCLELAHVENAAQPTLNAKVGQTDKILTIKKHSREENLITNESDIGELADNNVHITNRNTNVGAKKRIKRKTIIMFVVTLIFNVTMLIYFCALFVIIRRKHIFEVVDTDNTAILFFCWRIYFINHVINPVVYGLLDNRFREAFQKESDRDWHH